jgi:uncharacterized membrane protein
MLTKRHQILSWIEQGIIAPENAERALRIAGVFPDKKEWHRFVGLLLLGLGILSSVIGVIFFVAFNWDALGRFGKFALFEGLLIASLLPLLRYGAASRIGQFALLGASILVGALLALFGQIYQTGADTWELFWSWALLILPWVGLGRFAPLWILWIGIVNTELVLYFSLFPSPQLFGRLDEGAVALAVLIFNALVSVIWEFALWSRPSSNRIALYVPATLAGIAATILGFWAIMDLHDGRVLWFAIWLSWLGTNCLFYRYKIRDLLMLTGGCLSAIIVFVGFLGKILIESHAEFFGFMVIAIALIASGASATTWLRHTARVWEASNE